MTVTTDATKGVSKPVNDSSGKVPKEALGLLMTVLTRLPKEALSLLMTVLTIRQQGVSKPVYDSFLTIVTRRI